MYYPSEASMMTGPLQAPVSVLLPHDAVIGMERKETAEGGNRKGYYPNGSYYYVKKFQVPQEWQNKQIYIEFEGVYSNAMVYVNNEYAGQCTYGYTDFTLSISKFLEVGKENEIKVIARTTNDSRWYTGGGIYRNVKILVAEAVHIRKDGVKLITKSADYQKAAIAVGIGIENNSLRNRRLRVLVKLTDADGNIAASDDQLLTSYMGNIAKLHSRLYVKEPKLWSIDEPNLYTYTVQLVEDTVIIDEETGTYGIRVLQLDTERGLQINGKTVRLYGCCIHHDNGVIGAAAIGRADERRVQLLKAAGYNAIRSSHNPMGKALLEACDKYGLVVMDELGDMWRNSKVNADYATIFEYHWRENIKAMVDKDFNHPCVVMYSIGNEIPDIGHASGAELARNLSNEFRRQDSTRYITAGVNCMLAVMDQLPSPDGKGQEINGLMADLGEMMNEVTQSDLVTYATAESFAALDIAGYNYAECRYAKDAEAFPNRIIVGSETFPGAIARNWKLMEQYSNIIGDFGWTGWDYLGEAGIGKNVYDEKQNEGIYAVFPYFAAYCGDFDLIGSRRPQSYWREIAVGKRKKPYIAVQDPAHYGKKAFTTPWSWTDSISSWTWNKSEGKPVVIEIYSDAEEVKLFKNGVKVGEKTVGTVEPFKAFFETDYQPGTLEAIAYSQGMETGRYALVTAAEPAKITAIPDRDEIRADDTDLVYVTIRLEDLNGNLVTCNDRMIKVTVAGAHLQGLGSANPQGLDNFTSGACKTFCGEALAVIRPERAGEIGIYIEAEDCRPVGVNVTAK